MKPVVITLAGSLLGAALGFAASAAQAADSPHSFAAKRQFASQVIGCMRKRMAEDKFISYNRAAKACKDEVTRDAAAKPVDASAAGPLVAADTPR